MNMVSDQLLPGPDVTTHSSVKVESKDTNVASEI